MFYENKCWYFTRVAIEEFPDNCDDVEYYQWAKEDRTVKKFAKSVDVEKVNELFNEQVKILKAHTFVKRTKNTHYDRQKKILKQMNL